MSSIPVWLEEIIVAEALPAGFVDIALNRFLPVAKQIHEWHRGFPLVIGINGAQGTGKSTLSLVLSAALKHEYAKSAAIISIDDLYLTKGERVTLGEKIHPLLSTRGVPGTHDVELGIEVINDLKSNHLPIALPSFDKATDDRRDESVWESVTEPVDVIILEGWCVGAVEQVDDKLSVPLNELEHTSDSDGAWRRYVNSELESRYPDLFSLIDRLIMLKAPDFECVYQWRGEQEQKLRDRVNSVSNEACDQSGIMSDSELKRFIMHYERLTRWMLEEMPDRADIVIALESDHTVHKVIGI